MNLKIKNPFSKLKTEYYGNITSIKTKFGKVYRLVLFMKIWNDFSDDKILDITYKDLDFLNNILTDWKSKNPWNNIIKNPFKTKYKSNYILADKIYSYSITLKYKYWYSNKWRVSTAYFEDNKYKGLVASEIWKLQNY